MELYWPLFAYLGMVALHCWWWWRCERKAANDQAMLQRQLEMLREAIALNKYGARSEAIKLIDDAVKLKSEFIVNG